METKIKTIGLVGVMLVAGWLTASRQLLINRDPVDRAQSKAQQANPVTTRKPLYVGKVEIPVEVRRTAEEMELGLSYRKSLEANTGMAFVYSTPKQVMYWMKGMEFPLDFIWVANGIVVEITEEVAAPTADNPVPRTLVPAQEIDMVVEVNSGFVRSHGIRVGDEVGWTKRS